MDFQTVTFHYSIMMEFTSIFSLLGSKIIPHCLDSEIAPQSTVKWKELIWPKCWVCWGQNKRVQFGTGLGSIQPHWNGAVFGTIFELNRLLKGPNWTMRRANLENTGATLEFKGGQNGPRNFSSLTNDPLKNSQFSSNVGHFRSRGLFPLHADFPPYIQIMKIHHILYLSNTHLLGSRYCLCKNLLCYLILQLLRILIVV